MVRERFKNLTRANVIQLGLLVFGLGAIGYAIFRFVGFDGVSAGIAAEAILVFIVFGWTGTYLLRVVTGKMTFIEQRKRYKQTYEELMNSDLQARFDSLSEDEKVSLLNEFDDQGSSESSDSR